MPAANVALEEGNKFGVAETVGIGRGLDLSVSEEARLAGLLPLGVTNPSA
jgi:hypothetical protein